METLTHFNQQVLQCQDDAYTLAWYLLGDEAQAEAAVKDAVRIVFNNNAANGSCRVSIFRTVIQHCQAQLHATVPITGISDDNEIFGMLRTVPEDDRLALILVDILGLCYVDAAAIIGIQVHDLSQRLAYGRQRSRR